MILEANVNNINRAQLILDNFGRASSLSYRWEATQAFYILANPLPLLLQFLGW